MPISTGSGRRTKCNARVKDQEGAAYYCKSFTRYGQGAFAQRSTAASRSAQTQVLALRRCSKFIAQSPQDRATPEYPD
jgi:hypothetical protein